MGSVEYAPTYLMGSLIVAASENGAFPKGKNQIWNLITYQFRSSFSTGGLDLVH
jgi:hypothetical protein